MSGSRERLAAFDRSSTGHVGAATDQAGYQLGCSEVWGGNNLVADELVKLPGMAARIHSSPAERSTTGGDVYYLSVCDKRVLSRVVLADVAGHGQAIDGIAKRLRMLVTKYINTFDQSALMREINEAFRIQNDDLAQYATAVVLSYYCITGELILASAGHPPTLWYHANQREWDWLHEGRRDLVKAYENLPLGVVEGTEYEQTHVRLAENDLLLLYTDGITECANEAGNELGYEGLRKLLRDVPVEPSIATASALVAAVDDFRGSTPCPDDQSVIVLQRTEGCT